MDSKTFRHQHLMANIDRAGTIEDLVKGKDISPQYISQLKNKTRGIGDKTARKLEKAFGDPIGSWDRPLDTEEKPPTASTSNLPHPTFEQLVKIGAGQLKLSDISKTYPNNEACSDKSLVVTVWNDANYSKYAGLREGEEVLVDLNEPVTPGSLGLYYLGVGTAVIARFTGAGIEFVNVSAPPPPESDPKPMGRLMAVMAKRL